MCIIYTIYIVAYGMADLCNKNIMTFRLHSTLIHVVSLLSIREFQDS